MRVVAGEANGENSCLCCGLQVKVYNLMQYEHGADDVLVMGTDGLWDVLSNQEVAEAVTTFLANCDPDDLHRYFYLSLRVKFRTASNEPQWLNRCFLCCPGIRWQHRTWWCEHVACWGTEAGGSTVSAWAPEMTSLSSSYRWCMVTVSPEAPGRDAVVQGPGGACRLFDQRD